MPTQPALAAKVAGVHVTPSVEDTSPTLTVMWQALAEGAVTYTVKYSTQPGEVNTPPEGALEVTGISGTSTILTALERGTTYYIWMVGVSEGGEGPHSDRMSEVTYDSELGSTSCTINQSINQSHILNTSPRQEVVLTSYNYSVQQKHFTEKSPYILYYLKLSNHRNRGLPFGLFPSMTPSNTLLVHLSLPIPSNLSFHSSCLFFTFSSTPTWPSLCRISSLVIRSFRYTPSILLSTFMCVAWNFDYCSFRTAHGSHPYIKTGCCIYHLQFSLLTQLSPPQNSLVQPSNDSWCTPNPCFYFSLHTAIITDHSP